jgi:alpha-tubulin suppressor-like RCC1 family protein
MKVYLRSVLGFALCWFVLLSALASSQSPNVAVLSRLQSTIRQQVTVGGDHSCRINVDGFAFCWGSGKFGQLGNDATNDSSLAVAVAPPNTQTNPVAFSGISAGLTHTCGVSRDGLGYCWGNGSDGQLGNGTTLLDASVPVAVVAPLGGSAPLRFSSISAGAGHTCGLTTDGRVFCWGQGDNGRLGRNTLSSSSLPMAISLGNEALRFSHVAVGYAHACALSTTSAVFCWGAGSEGQLGNGTALDSSVPVAVVQTELGSDEVFSAVSAGFVHSCAVTNKGNAYCWGFGVNGRLGNNNLVNSTTPVRVLLPQVDGKVIVFANISAGGLHTCGTSTSGIVYCWGFGGFGQLGNNSLEDAPTPSAITAIQTRYDTVSVGFAHTCGTSQNQVFCWGLGFNGRLGYEAEYSSLPKAVQLSR